MNQVRRERTPPGPGEHREVGWPRVDVLAEDPGLAQGLSSDRAIEAGRRAHARVICVSKGRWYPPESVPREGGVIGLLVLEGLLIRRVTLADRHSVDLLSRSDIIRPFESEADWVSMVPSEVGWQVLAPTRLAVIDARFARAMCDYPEVISHLMGRVAQRSQAQAQRLAIVQQRRLSARLYFLLWQLADRYGRVTPAGVIIPLQLSQEILAELVCARRPSVCKALKELEHHGLFSRLSDGTWCLGAPPAEGLTESWRVRAPIRA